MTHFKIACGAASALALLITFAVGRSPSKPPAEASSVTVSSEAAMHKADKILPPPVRVIAIEKIKLEEPPPPPPLPVVEKTREHKKFSDVCARHGLRKVKVGRYRWRCR